MKQILLLFLFILSSCSTTRIIADNDDMYFDRNRGLNSRMRVYRTPQDIYYNPNYNWYNYDPFYSPLRFYPPRQIIIIEKENNNFNYGKRPTREGNFNREPSTIRRGRN